MQIANPIYDSVFRYLMDDNKVARLLLSAIMSEDIVSLEYRPTKLETELQPQLTVLIIDFAAKIRSADGLERLVIIEIQKAKYATDIMRFRKYLGTQYANPENVSMVKEPETVYKKKALPIVSIYFLGYMLDVIKAPVIKVQREYCDVTTGKIIPEKEEFIESLTHDSYVIQIPYLSKKRQTELLQVLSVFDQSNRAEDYHILNVKEEEFPEQFRSVIRRLQRAIEQPEMRQKMNAEDLFLEELQDIQRTVEENKKEIEENKKEIEENKKEIEENKKEIEENKKEIEEKDKVIEENKKVIEEKNKIIAELMKKK